LREQRHLKWRALDPLENALMVLCGIAITGFSVLVLGDIVTRAILGLITPPYGLCLLMSAKFVGVRFSRAMLASLPIYIVFAAIARLHHLLSRRGAVAAAEAPAPVGRLLRQSRRRGLHLSLSRDGRACPGEIKAWCA
jgi:hypothetical protein